MLVKFGIRGNLRFLSHAETIELFQRACIRAGIKLHYSQGFNPRPRLSLPLPRSVGVESDEELLCLEMAGCVSSFDVDSFRVAFCSVLPEGCDLGEVNAVNKTRPPQPCRATYVFTVKEKYCGCALKARIERLLASEKLVLERRADARGNVRTLNVRDFLKTIEMADTKITVKCKTGPGGSIRVDEILRLLELDVEKLAAPIRREAIEWQFN